ncbi:hypothetical protein MYX82_05065 [Acidobacteria bacterium AH-259-D05]|nr:hypothetical protein [Acidobacteria bacterium AH-259-D05]
MAEIVDLVPGSTIAKTRQAQKKNSRAGLGYRAMRLARKVAQRKAEELPEDTSKKSTCTTENATEAHQPTENFPKTVPMAKPSGETPPTSSDSAQLHATIETYQAAECFQLFQIEAATVVVFWRLNKIDDWTAPLLGACCKELLTHSELKQVVFDFSLVVEMSTAAIATLVQFKNTIVHLDKTMHVVAGAKLREQLEQALIARVFSIQDSIHVLLGSEIQFLESMKFKTKPGKVGLLDFVKGLFKRR